MEVITDIRIVVTKGQFIVEKEVTTIETQHHDQIYEYGSRWETVPIETESSDH